MFCMSPHTISENETKSLANLARLSLTDKEHAEYKKDIENILGFIDTIKDVTTKDTELTQVGFAPVGVSREDSVMPIDSALPKKLVNQSPKNANNSIKVKKIIAQ